MIRPAHAGLLLAAAWCFADGRVSLGQASADEPPTFHRAFNLNGPALEIGGHA